MRRILSFALMLVATNASASVKVGEIHSARSDVLPILRKSVDEEVARITRETYARVQEILARRRDDLERLARRLLETEVLEGEELQQLLYGATPASQSASAATATA